MKILKIVLGYSSLQKWHRENNQLPLDLRQETPKKPEINYKEASRDEQNAAAWDTFTSQLVACTLCNRTFFPDRLPIHQKACKGRDGSKAQSTTSIQSRVSVPASNFTIFFSSLFLHVIQALIYFLHHFHKIFLFFSHTVI